MPASHPNLVNVLEWPDYFFIALYFAVNIAIGWWVQRKKRNSGADYFLGGGRVPPWAGAVSYYGTAECSTSAMSLESTQRLKQFGQRQLRALLQEVQTRLGTSAERHNDVSYAQAIAHQLNNLLTAIRLQADLEKVSPIGRKAF